MSRPNLQHLKMFAEVAKHGSFSKTSVILGIAQPTISRQISELETHWHGALFYRTGRGVELSDLGQKALVRTLAILRDIDHLADDMRSERGAPSGEVTVAAVPSLVITLLPSLIKELRAERPGIRIRVLEAFGEQVTRWVTDGTADIGLYARYFEAVESDPGPLHASRILLITPKTDTEMPAEVAFADLEMFDLVLPMQPNALRRCIDTLARQRNLRLNIVAEAVSFMAQKEIASHCGYSFLAERSLPTLTQVEADFCSAVIRDPYLLRKVVLSTSHGTPMTRAARDVAERLERLMSRKDLDFDTI